ncbi:MAG: hypothetical protein KKD44_21400 [Proteobacteria bacterium]|nr:hypothetical protein [Pseudomonadota bacterium]
MKQDEIYRHLKDLAENLGIRFAEKNFRNAGIPVNSGLCKIEGVFHFYMDKHKRPREKNEILANTLSQFPLDDIYIIPALREFIDQHNDQG